MKTLSGSTSTSTSPPPASRLNLSFTSPPPASRLHIQLHVSTSAHLHLQVSRSPAAVPPARQSTVSSLSCTFSSNPSTSSSLCPSLLRLPPFSGCHPFILKLVFSHLWSRCLTSFFHVLHTRSNITEVRPRLHLLLINSKPRPLRSAPPLVMRCRPDVEPHDSNPRRGATDLFMLLVFRAHLQTFWNDPQSWSRQELEAGGDVAPPQACRGTAHCSNTLEGTFILLLSKSQSSAGRSE